MTYFTDIAPAGEEATIKQITDLVIASQLRAHQKGGLLRRFAHGKSNGMVQASFHVLDIKQTDLKVGLFARPATYPALLRFSLGSGGVSFPDILPNVHGAALKILNVPGKKLLPGDEDSLEHDFLMANDKTFFCRTIDEMIYLGKKDFIGLMRHYPGTVLRIIKALNKVVVNPLFTEYHSQVPYQLGDYACKYALIPFDVPRHAAMPHPLDRDYLRHGVQEVLSQNSAQFWFGVHLRNNGKKHDSGESIADSTVAWRGKFIPLARVEVTKRDSSPLLESTGEELSFSPWRVLAEHKPLSWVGRTRLKAYPADFELRSKINSKGR